MTKKWTKQDLKKVVGNYQAVELAAEQLAAEYCGGRGLRVKSIKVTGIEYDGKEGYIYFTRTGSMSDYRGRRIAFPSRGWNETEKQDHHMPIGGLFKSPKEAATPAVPSFNKKKK